MAVLVNPNGILWTINIAGIAPSPTPDRLLAADAGHRVRSACPLAFLVTAFRTAVANRRHTVLNCGCDERPIEIACSV
jgi:hypothetical protein